MVSKERANPILRGIIDTMLGVELVRQSSIPHKNRLAVILIDSAFETACRGYLQHVAKVTLTDAHKHRDTLVKTIKSKLNTIDEQVWSDIDYYYTEIRCDFYHQSAGKTITDVTLLDYKETVEFVIDQAFGIKIDELVKSQNGILNEGQKSAADATFQTSVVPVSSLQNRTDKVLVAVAELNPSDVEQVNDYFKKEGDALRLKQDEFINIVARNSGSKKLFYFDKSSKTWTLSGLGRFRISQIQKEVANDQ
ncbi:MAG: hypothetical protein HUU11_02025 [Anaerolineales bacterium]|nr:hypothetical protein [Anaerolineales bacterium]